MGILRARWKGTENLTSEYKLENHDPVLQLVLVVPVMSHSIKVLSCERLRRMCSLGGIPGAVRLHV
eukprot:367847-Amorphochlora_amoeboformis.AAC.1